MDDFLAQIFRHSCSSTQKLLRTIIIAKMENWGRRQHHQTDHRGARCGGFLNTLIAGILPCHRRLRRYSSVVKGHMVTKLTIRKSIDVHLQVFTCATGGVKGLSKGLPLLPQVVLPNTAIAHHLDCDLLCESV